MRHKMLGVAGLASILVVVGARAQQRGQASPSQPEPESTQAVRTAPNQSVIRASVNLVSIPVVARDAKGQLVMDLVQRSLRVFDNGVPQKLEAFEMSSAPLSVAIVVENSSRIEPLLPELRRTGVLFTQTVLGEDGEASVIGYNDQVVKLLDFTGDDDAIEKTFADLRPGTSGTNLYDALSEAVNILADLPPSRRRVIITLAEARDTGSEEKLSQVLREAQTADITIYSVGLSTLMAEVRGPQQQAAPLLATPPGTYGLTPIPGAVDTPTVEELRNGNIDLGGLVRPVWAFAARTPPLQEAVAATGGSYKSTTPSTSIENAIDEIGGELNAQYTLSYLRVGSDAPGYHQIKVEVAGQKALKVRARSGYYLVQP